MRFYQFSQITMTLVLIGLCTLTGCGSAKPTTVTGKVTVPAEMKLSDTDSIEVHFIPSDDKGKVTSGTYNAKDGSFTANVVPGKYKISVKIVPYPGMADSQKRSQELSTFLKKFDDASSPLTVEIGAEPQSITIDLDKKTVSK